MELILARQIATEVVGRCAGQLYHTFDLRPHILPSTFANPSLEPPANSSACGERIRCPVPGAARYPSILAERRAGWDELTGLAA